MKAGKILLAIFIFLAMQVIGGIFAVVSTGNLEKSMNGEEVSLSADALALTTIISGVLSVLVVWLALQMIELKKVFIPQNATIRKNWYVCTLAILGAFAGIFSTNLLSEQLALPNLMEEQFLEMSRSVIGILSIAVAAPIVEELIFREGIIGFLTRKGTNPWISIGVSSLAFGIIHLNPAQIPFAVLIGIILGFLYYHTRNIVLCATVHVLNNTLAVLEMNLLGEKASTFSYSDLLGGDTLVCAFIIVLAAICVCLLHLFHKKYQTSGNELHFAEQGTAML